MSVDNYISKLQDQKNISTCGINDLNPPSPIQNAYNFNNCIIHDNLFIYIIGTSFKYYKGIIFIYNCDDLFDGKGKLPRKVKVNDEQPFAISMCKRRDTNLIASLGPIDTKRNSYAINVVDLMTEELLYIFPINNMVCLYIFYKSYLFIYFYLPLI